MPVEITSLVSVGVLLTVVAAAWKLAVTLTRLEERMDAHNRRDEEFQKSILSAFEKIWAEVDKLRVRI